MNIDRITNVRPAGPDTPVTVKRCGNLYEIRYMTSISEPPPTYKLDADHFVDVRTGEVKDITHSNTRADDKASVAQSLRKLRDLINTNLTNSETVLWVTLTYAENMTDSVRLYEDYRRFWQRLRYYLEKHEHPPAEYITAAEPQGRGAWHLHSLFLFPGMAPFIPNADIARVWGHGFTKTKSLAGIDNPGLYLTAYLGDMELMEALSSGVKRGRLAETETVDEQGRRRRKAIVKGGRLCLYPPGFNLYRFSRGVARPEVWQTTEGEAQTVIGAAPLIYEKTIAVTDGAGDRINVINYRQYNRCHKT